MTKKGTSETRLKVLLVDDDAAVRALVRRILAPRLFDLLEADSSEAALALAAAELVHVDLLLTDVVMPNGTGTALATRLRERWAHLRVLFMSGYGKDMLATLGLAANDDFLEKPFTPHTLREGVQRAMNGGSP